MSQHIYAHEHPESETDRGGGFTLWFTGPLRAPGKTTIAHHVGPELDRRGLVVEYLDGDTVRTHLSKGLGFSKEDRDAHVERLGWVASRDHAPRRRGHRRGDLPVRAGAEERSRARRGARPVRRDPRHDVARRVRAPRRERPLREGVRRRDQGLHGRRRSVRGAGEPGDRGRHRGPRARGVGRGRDREARGARVSCPPRWRRDCRHDRSPDRAPRRHARRPHRRRAGRSRRARGRRAHVARALRPRHDRLGRALAARGLHGQGRLRARRRGDAPRERPAVGASRLPRRRLGAAR